MEQLQDLLAQVLAQENAMTTMKESMQSQLEEAHRQFVQHQSSMMDNQRSLMEQLTHVSSQNVTLTQQIGQARQGGHSPSVQKWAPDHFDGTPEAWSDWDLKFASYLGKEMNGTVGEWMSHVEKRRSVSALTAVLGQDSKASASHIYGALIATCQNKALTIVRKAGAGEGLEAYRLLLLRYDARSRQTRVMRLLEVLAFNFKSDCLLDSLESFEQLVVTYEKESSKTLDDDLKIGIVIKGIETGSLREHLLLHSERADTYELFREEIDTIARAQHASLMPSQPMDLSAFVKGGKAKGKGKGGAGKSMTQAFQGDCNNCGKPGHKKQDCRSAGGGAHKHSNSGPPGKQQHGNNKVCYKCGGTNHFARECKSSEAKIKAYRASKGGGKGLREMSDEQAGGAQAEANFDALYLCELKEESLQEVQRDPTDRSLTMRVDTAACRTVIPKRCRAARGYKTHKDGLTGTMYGTAKPGVMIRDEGQKVLQTKVQDNEPPMRMRVRSVDVQGGLLAVCDLVDNNHQVFFDNQGSYAVNKETKRVIPFVRNGKGWDLTLMLEAPETANAVMAKTLAAMTEQTNKDEQGVQAVVETEVDRAEPLFRLAVGPCRT